MGWGCSVGAETPRRWDTGLIRPYRPAPNDFRETYLRMGWDGIEDHYSTNYRCIARWIEECGGDELREARSKVTGKTTRPGNRRVRYRYEKLTAVKSRPSGG